MFSQPNRHVLERIWRHGRSGVRQKGNAGGARDRERLRAYRVLLLALTQHLRSACRGVRSVANVSSCRLHHPTLRNRNAMPTQTGRKKCHALPRRRVSPGHACIGESDENDSEQTTNQPHELCQNVINAPMVLYLVRQGRKHLWPGVTERPEDARVSRPVSVEHRRWDFLHRPLYQIPNSEHFERHQSATVDYTK